MNQSGLCEIVRAAVCPLSGAVTDYDGLLKMIGDARLVLIGEASHGTHEFYSERARITRRLIEEKGFGAVAVEADWPDAYHVNCYVRGSSPSTGARAALEGFQKFPAWMWRNTDVLEFVEWLHDYNKSLPDAQARAGFYGLDLYSLHTSIREVISYLERVDTQAAQRARERYSCFDHYGEDVQTYAYAAGRSNPSPCEDEVLAQLCEIQSRAAEYSEPDSAFSSSREAEDAFFYAQQNARLVKNAADYYRSMLRGRNESWNLRDTHMADTLDALVEHLSRRGASDKVVVWAHNSHLGDARATEMSSHGELNLGQLVRERHGHDAFLLGFSTYQGEVTAASDWGGPAERKRVRPALEGSYEAIFHKVGVPDFLLPLSDHIIHDPAVAVDGASSDGVHSQDMPSYETPANGAGRAARVLLEPHLERAIGVIYRPESERHSHYFYVGLPRQFDAIIHLDRTCAVEPLELAAEWERDEAPETFPTGF